MMGIAEDVAKWRESQPDLINDGKCGIIMRKTACEEYLKSARHHWQKSEGSNWRDEYRQEGWAEGFVICQNCPHYTSAPNPLRIKRNLQGRPGRVTEYGRKRLFADAKRQQKGRENKREIAMTRPSKRTQEYS